MYNIPAYPKPSPAFIEFKTAFPIIPKKYVLTTGNDTKDNLGRRGDKNPMSWTIKAKLNETDEWVTIAEVNNDKVFQNENFTSYTYDFTNPNDVQYQYFRFDITAIVCSNDQLMQLEETI